MTVVDPHARLTGHPAVLEKVLLELETVSKPEMTVDVWPSLLTKHVTLVGSQVRDWVCVDVMKFVKTEPTRFCRTNEVLELRS